MALVKVKNKNDPSSDQGVPQQHKKVLDEESFLGDLEKIIQRDFFPDLSKLKAQKEYIEARERNDLVRMRELALKYAATGQTRPDTGTPTPFSEATPATFETPDVNPRLQTPRQVAEGQGSSMDEGDNADKKGSAKDKGDTSLTLDRYLAGHTSEDNASFGEIMAKAEQQRRTRHDWLYEAEARHGQEQVEMLALEGPAAAKPIEGSSLNTWAYRAKNNVMYVPEGLEETVEEQIFKKPKVQQVVHRNTHFQANPHRPASAAGSSRPGQNAPLPRSGAAKAAMKLGRVGHDGKEIAAKETPKVNGYGFVGTPSPAPGAYNESPMMTWGEISGTPLRLEGSDTPLPSSRGPSFTIAQVPRKERLTLSLVEEVSKKHRAKKEKALRKVTESLVSPSPKRLGTLGTAERLHSLTPAARKLVQKRLSGFKTDSALRASYTPSPAPRPAGDSTPILLDSSTPSSRRTPGAGAGATPGGTPGRTPSSARLAEETLTDNLLDFPKRKARGRSNACDFF